MTNPLINAVTYKMAEYPVTELVFLDEDQDIRKKWQQLSTDVLRLRPFLIEVGLDYFTYGNAFVTVHFPFHKYLICRSCKSKTKINRAVYSFRNMKYYLSCNVCNTQGEADVEDVTIKSINDIKLIRWNPESVGIEHNEITGSTSYYLEISTSLKNSIIMGKRNIIEEIPHEFIEALRKGKSLKFTKENLFHLKRPTIAQKDQGWGMPLILPVLKDAYYLQILRKAQEAIANGYIVPLRLLFPQVTDSVSNPYSTTNLGLWRERIEAEIYKWRLDPNYIPVLPLPIGNQMIGGEGKALNLHQEMRAWSEQIIAGMHVPTEFIYGGLQYSGSNVSMRMLENQFLGYRATLLILCRDFILARIARYMDWPKPKVEFKRFKMADDLQRTALAFQMNQAQKISDTTLLEEADFDFVTEEKLKKEEVKKQIEGNRNMQIAQANIQGEVMKVQAKYQKEVQKMMAGAVDETSPAVMQAAAQSTPGLDQSQQGIPDGTTAYPENAQGARGIPQDMQSGIAGGAGADILYLAKRVAIQLEKKDEKTKNELLAQLAQAQPQLYQLVIQLLNRKKGDQSGNQQPLPEQRPPRGAKASV